VIEAAFAEAAEALVMKDGSTDVAIRNATVATKELLVLVDDSDKVEVSNTADIDQPLSSEDQEPPKSPWTPSYSVTNQGPNKASDEAELDDPEPLPQRAGPTESLKDVAMPEGAAAGEPKDIVPSVAVDEIQDTPGEVFPTVEDTDDVPEKLKSTGLRLAALDKPRVTEGASVSPDAVSPTTVRSRLESTASSRFFPGSWFSPSYKAADEGRTSLEVAQGEFVATKAAASVGDAPDTSGVEETSSAESDDDDDEAPGSSTSEQKRRWCVIM